MVWYWNGIAYRNYNIMLKFILFWNQYNSEISDTALNPCFCAGLETLLLLAAISSKTFLSAMCPRLKDSGRCISDVIKVKKVGKVWIAYMSKSEVRHLAWSGITLVPIKGAKHHFSLKKRRIVGFMWEFSSVLTLWSVVRFSSGSEELGDPFSLRFQFWRSIQKRNSCRPWLII